MPLIGQKVLLRPLEERDLPFIWDGYHDLDMHIITDGDAPPMSDIQVRDFWREIITDPGADLRYFAIEPLTNGQPSGLMIGGCSLQQIDMRNRHAELSIWIGQTEMRGQGFGREAAYLLVKYAFEMVNLERILLGVYEFNEAALRAYERIGFQYEGRLRRMLYYQNRWWDQWQMGLLRTEWDYFHNVRKDGLRPYHTADYEAVVDLIRRLEPSPKPLPGTRRFRDIPHSKLRSWWQRLDTQTWVLQMHGNVVGLALVDKRTLVDEAELVEPEYQAALANALAELRHTHGREG